MTRLRLPTKDGSRATFTLPKTPGVYAHVWFDEGVAYSDFGSRVPDSGEWQVIISTSEDPLNMRPRGRELGREVFRFPEKKAEAAVRRMAEEYIGRQLTQQARRLKRAARMGPGKVPPKAGNVMGHLLNTRDRKAIQAVWAVLWMGLENALAPIVKPLKAGKLDPFRDKAEEGEDQLYDEWEEDIELSGGPGYTVETPVRWRAELHYHRHYELDTTVRMNKLQSEVIRIAGRGLTARLLPSVSPQQVADLYLNKYVQESFQSLYGDYLNGLWTKAALQVETDAERAINQQLDDLEFDDGDEEFDYGCDSTFDRSGFAIDAYVHYQWSRDEEHETGRGRTYRD